MRTLEGITGLIAVEWEQFEKEFTKAIASEDLFIGQINGYLLKNTGKKIRPLLSLLTARSQGEVNALSIKCAIVSEVMHTASLLHDDVADNSKTRRGVPTINNLFSPAASVLMGDYWLSKAISVLVNQSLDIRILQSFSSAMSGLSEGELIQMDLIGNTAITQEDYIRIVSKKTSSLFIAAMKSAALSVEALDEIVESFEQCGYYLGIAFQIRDDILDYKPNENTGKPSLSDIKERKITIPLIGAITNSLKNGDGKERQRVLGIITQDNEQLYLSEENIATVQNFISQNEGIGYAEKLLKETTQKAINSLSRIDQSQYKDAIINIIEML